MSRRDVARLRVARMDLGGPVLDRIVLALGARIDLPVDRLADAQLVCEALAAARNSLGTDGALCVSFTIDGPCLELSVGPLQTGAAQALVAESALPGVGPLLERLVDDWSIVDVPGGREALRLRIAAAETVGAVD